MNKNRTLSFKSCMSFLIATLTFSNGVAQNVLLSENFNSGIPVMWQVAHQVDTAFTWRSSDDLYGVGTGANADGTYGLLVGGANGFDGVEFNEIIITPTCNADSYSVVTLYFDHIFYPGFSHNEYGYIDVYNGSEWKQVKDYHPASKIGNWGNPDKVTLDISAYRNPSLKVRFRFVKGSSGYTWGWFIDNVKISGTGVIGIQEHPEHPEILIHPNPSAGNFSVKMNEPSAAGLISVYDLKGRMLYSRFLETGSRINLTGQPPGLYFILVDNGRSRHIIKHVITED